MPRTFPIALAAALALTLPARATPISLRLGADALVNGGPGVFSLGLGLESGLGKKVSVGARFGGLITTSPTTGGIPIDVFLRVRINRMYVEGVGGPWIFFSEGDTVRGHIAGGLGLLMHDWEFGAEIGYLSPDRTQLGLRVGVRL